MYNDCATPRSGSSASGWVGWKFASQRIHIQTCLRNTAFCSSEFQTNRHQSHSIRLRESKWRRSCWLHTTLGRWNLHIMTGTRKYYRPLHHRLSTFLLHLSCYENNVDVWDPGKQAGTLMHQHISILILLSKLLHTILNTQQLYRSALCRSKGCRHVIASNYFRPRLPMLGSGYCDCYNNVIAITW